MEYPLSSREGERLAAAFFDYLGVDDEYHDKAITIETDWNDAWITWESRARLEPAEFARIFNDLQIKGDTQ